MWTIVACRNNGRWERDDSVVCDDVGGDATEDGVILHQQQLLRPQARSDHVLRSGHAPLFRHGRQSVGTMACCCWSCNISRTWTNSNRTYTRRVLFPTTFINASLRFRSSSVNNEPLSWFIHNANPRLSTTQQKELHCPLARWQRRHLLGAEKTGSPGQHAQEGLVCVSHLLRRQ